jgi:methylenetetrahydrofolate reductase (NADPH)
MRAETVVGCPKRMIFGPCGGVRPDASCEMQDGPCVFPDVVPWPSDGSASAAATNAAAALVGQAPLVLTDFSVAPFDAGSLRQVAATLAGACDAVLVGEHQHRPDFPPTLAAAMLLDLGLVPWVTLTCRDRNRIVLEQELRGLHHVGARTVLCVTGDGRAYDVRPEVTQVFDLDGTRLAALAATVGLVPAVAETPTAPPRDLRPLRLVEKQRAGAAVAVLNHAGRPDDVADFVRAARAAGLTIPVIAAVAVYTDEMSAAVLSALPGLAVDPGNVAEVLAASDPVEAGIDRAVAEARALLSIDGVSGVNLSGLASARGYAHAADIKAEIGNRIRGSVS